MLNHFNGLGMSLGNLSCLSSARTRSISAENPSGEKGGGGKLMKGSNSDYARELGQSWKISPCIYIAGNETVVLAEIEEPGAIQHIWMTIHPSFWRRLVLRCYWDGEHTPSVEVPLGDFFCNGWGVHCNINSLPVAVNPSGGFNCYWQMPFKQRAKITIENLSPDKTDGFYYQVDYTLTDISESQAYFHAQYRRDNPLQYKEVHTLLDGVVGRGQYVGTYIAWGSNNSGWWGEGEMKFYLDGDGQWPTICGTGTEDYFGGAWCFMQPDKSYGVFSTPFLGFPQVIKPDGFFQSQMRFGLYRWHIMDPIRFEHDIRVTIQALGWRSALEGKRRYLPLQDDIASTAFWYQSEPHTIFPKFPSLNHLEVI